MNNLKSIIDEVLYERKEKTLKLFYNIDVFLQDFGPEKEAEKEEPVAPTPEEPSATAGITPETAGIEAEAPMESTKHKRDFLNEDIYKQRAVGELSINKDNAENIQTIEDLFEYLTDKKESKEVTDGLKTKPKKILDDSIIEIIKALTGDNPDAIKDLVDTGDKIQVSLDYGNAKDDSIGVNLNKNAGSDSITLTIKKNNRIIPGPFDEALFNRELLNFRNELVG